LGVANTMLDGSAVTQDEVGRRRRRDRAARACDEVVRYLEIDARRHGLSTVDRDEISSGLRAVRARLASAGA
jgi:hypothetical protein